MGLPQRRHQGHRAITSLLVRADRERPHLSRMTPGASFSVVLTQSALASQTKLALALDKSTAALGPGLPAVRKIPESHDQHPGFHSPQEAKGVFCP